MFKSCATRLLTTLLTTLFAVLSQLAAAAEYRIGAQDKLRIKVHEWPALSDDMSVSPAGTLSLPIIGMLTVAGRTAGEIANEISNQLQLRAKLPEKPFTSVEILQFRSFYVVGDVQRPGDYQYRPQMSVLMAVSIAGGAYRPPEAALVRAERDIVISQSGIAVLENTKRVLSLRKARLEAELAGKKSLGLDRKLSYPPGMEEEELALMRARTENHEAQVAGFRGQIKHAQEEIELSEARVKANAKQQLSADKEAVGLRRLSEKGLGLAYREAVLERLTAKIEGDDREIDVQIARARQMVSQAESSLAKLISERERDIRTELRQVAVQLDEADQQILLQRNLIAEAETFGAVNNNQPMRIGKNKLRLRFRIARTGDEGTAEFGVDQHDQVQPGDVVIVEQVMSAEQAMGDAIREDAAAQIGQALSPLRR
jgi:protein involved in polysaccharide export with SLBB domain